MKVSGAALASAFIVTSAVQAQVATPAPVQTAPIAAGATDTSTLRTGTRVSLRTMEELTTQGRRLRVGQHFNLQVAEPVLVGGQIVIPAGSPAVGEITEVRNKGMWGKSGHLTAQLLYVSVNGRQIRLTGTFDDKGVTGTAGVVGAAVLIPVAGFFMTGTSARVPLGAAVNGFIGEDIPVALASAPQAPLVAQPAVADSVATQPTAIQASATTAH